jgi:hypothetical protein
MHPFLSRKSSLKLKVLGWYQILGGAAGILVTLYILVRTAQISGLALILYLFVFCLYGFSAWCGQRLLSDRYIRGLKLSIINQALQILSFFVSGYGYTYVSGAMVFAGIRLTHGFIFTFNFGIMSSWQININTDAEGTEIAINLVAIFFIYFIEKLLRTTKQEEADFNSASLADDYTEPAGDEPFPASPGE